MSRPCSRMAELGEATEARASRSFMLTAKVAGKKFCKECGTALAVACGSCGAALAGDEKFCDECGGPVHRPETGSAQAAVAREAPASERRLVSILFADLVGFTPLSESRD